MKIHYNKMAKYGLWAIKNVGIKINICNKIIVYFSGVLYIVHVERIKHVLKHKKA